MQSLYIPVAANQGTFNRPYCETDERARGFMGKDSRLPGLFVVYTTRSGLSLYATRFLKQKTGVSDVGPKTLKLLFAGLVVVGALSYLAVQGVRASAAVQLGLPDLLSRTGEYADKRIEVGGKVVPGSIDKSPGAFSFQIQELDSILKVRYVGDEPIPDGIYADDAVATVRGIYRHEGCVDATSVRTKCASKYRSDSGLQVEAGAEDYADKNAS